MGGVAGRRRPEARGLRYFAESTGTVRVVRTTILAYHAIGACAPADDPFNLWVAREDFARQMAWLARHRRVVPLDDLLTGDVGRGRPAVAITFDDGYTSVLREAVPVLDDHGFPATMFVPTAFLGDRNRWDPPQRCDLSIVDGDGVREFERRGVRVESHGHAHLDMRSVRPDEVRSDLVASREAIERLVGRRPSLLAWPFRDGSPAAREVAREVGFRRAFSIDLPDAGPFSSARVQVTPRDDDRVFALKTSGWWPRLRHNRVLDSGHRMLRGLRSAPTSDSGPRA